VKALVKAVPGPGLELTEVPDPTPGPGDVLLRVLRTGICGTDLHIEACDLVSGESHLICGMCHNCRAGRRHLCANTIGLSTAR